VLSKNGFVQAFSIGKALIEVTLGLNKVSVLTR